ncbi:hypothetical protein RUND412_003465 [Rhizina undulata]
MLRVIPYPPPRSMMNGENRANGYPAPPHIVNGTIPKDTADRPSPGSVSRAYRTCTNLFLTRRLPEALATLQPVLIESASPKGKCSRSLRIKVWSLYFAILDAAAKMGSEEGRKVFGGSDWRRVVGRIRTGMVWDEAIGAFGDEGRLDAELVIALVMLLLAHSQDQSKTQQKIEAYLSAAPGVAHDDDPKAISQRVRIIEFYILHVLPRVGEWEYAREFTQMSPELDEEQKEAFLSALDALRKEKEEAEEHSRQLQRQREEELEFERRQQEEAQKRDVSPAASSSSSRRQPSVDGRSRKSKASSVKGDAISEARANTKKPSSMKNKDKTNGVVSRNSAGRSKNPSLFRSTTALFSRLQSQMYTAHGRFLLLRTVFMLAMVVWVTSKKRIREKIRKMLLIAWIKMTRTVGMGMKVTYI